MGFQLELGDNIILTGTGIDPGCEFSMCLPRGITWYVPLGLRI